MERSGIELHCAPGATMSNHKLSFYFNLTEKLSPHPHTPTLITPTTKEEETTCV